LKWAGLKDKFINQIFFFIVMVLKVIEATEMRVGTVLMIDGSAHTVRKMDISKTGKHGHAKVRFEAISIMTGKKKVGVVPGHDNFECPLVDKREAQVLSIAGDKASIMDSQSFENLELPIPEELKETLKDGVSIEYWDIEGAKLIKRVI
jgi:translation initiation factor 5A